MQAQIRPVDMPPFQPPWWLKNAHLQTIFAKYLKSKQQVLTQSEILPLPDGDELQLNWLSLADPMADAPVVLLLHGLAGDINSHYIQTMLAECYRLRWPAVLMHFRGCNGQPNKLPRAYHSGDTADIAVAIDRIQCRYPARPLTAIGYSLGGNVLLKYIGEQAEHSPLAAAVAVCPPLSLAACATRINQGSSKLYQHYLLARLKSSTLAKLRQFPSFPLPLTAAQVKTLRSIEQFDECYTAPIHGFLNAQDYYSKASGKAYLRHICIPTLIIHAKDDPFLSDEVIPQIDELSPYIHYELTGGGGHVGFVYGSPLHPRFWLTQRIPHFLAEQLTL